MKLLLNKYFHNPQTFLIWEKACVQKWLKCSLILLWFTPWHRTNLQVCSRLCCRHHSSRCVNQEERRSSTPSSLVAGRSIRCIVHCSYNWKYMITIQYGSYIVQDNVYVSRDVACLVVEAKELIGLGCAIGFLSISPWRLWCSPYRNRFNGKEGLVLSDEKVCPTYSCLTYLSILFKNVMLGQIWIDHIAFLFYCILYVRRLTTVCYTNYVVHHLLWFKIIYYFQSYK